MSGRRLVLALCGALVATVLSSLAVSAAESDVVAIPSDAPGGTASSPAVARGLIVQTESGVSTSTLREAAEDVAGSDADVTDATRSTSTYSTVSFDEPVPYTDAAEIAADLQERGDVVAAVPDGRVKATANAPVSTNDPAFTRQYQLWDKRLSPAGGYSVKAPALWRSTKGTSDTVVAVLDTGILKSHPDLKNQLVAGYDMIGPDQTSSGAPLPSGSSRRYYTANDGNGRDSDPSDPGDWINAHDGYCYDGTNEFEASSWHGSHVAGIIAAQDDNATGISGIAPNVKIQPVRVLGKCGGWDSDILDAITWASGGSVSGVPANKTPANIINMSLGGSAKTSYQRAQACNIFSPVVAAARSRGTTVIAAAGNELGNANLALPASCGGVISVGATSETGQQAFYSNEGTSVDLSAPGGDQVIERSASYRHGVLSSIDKGSRKPTGSTYAEYQGTSMATPAVAAGAALIHTLGVTSPAAVEAALEAAVAPFRNRSAYSDITLTGGGKTYELDLNCTTSTCGAGVLDLSRVSAPRGRPAIAGTLAEGELLTAENTWGGPAVTKSYQWYRDSTSTPISGATAQTYTVQPADVGHRLKVRVSAADGPFAGIHLDSYSSGTVGVTISLSGLPSSLTYGTNATATVALTDVAGPVAGTVTIKRGSTTLVSKAATSNGTVSLTVPGTRWAGGKNELQAVFTSGSQGASTPTRAVTVYRAVPTALKITVSPTVKYTAKGTLYARVTVPKVSNPRGTFYVYDGSRRIQKASLAADGNGLKKITLPKLAKGKHRLTVRLGGTSLLAPKTSAVRTVTSK